MAVEPKDKVGAYVDPTLAAIYRAQAPQTPANLPLSFDDPAKGLMFMGGAVPPAVKFTTNNPGAYEQMKWDHLLWLLQQDPLSQKLFGVHPASMSGGAGEMPNSYNRDYEYERQLQQILFPGVKK